MSVENFHSIVKRLKNREIEPEEAKRLLAALKNTRTQPDENSADKPDSANDIAVIGISGQFPGARTVAEFWRNLIEGRDGVGELPAEYLDQKNYFSPEKQFGKTYCKWGGILEERHCFDPSFFNLSPREAESMNPHQRLIMQEGWKALEDAGYNPAALGNTRTGVFIGAEPSGYFHETFTGASDAIIASRLSYYLDLKGPALVVNTGCSSSAVAIHLACESLRGGESSMALAGGVFATMGQLGLINLARIEMLSPSGRCYTFDQAGDGTVLSEGVGIVVLKPLRAALADGDPVYGVICASGMNQDGSSNGITAPNGIAQEELIADVYRRFGINPERIGYIEAHGTGTQLGDPVEANALVRAFRQFTDKQHYCAVGSAKSHIGHTSAAAGVISLIKILLSLRHHKLPGLLHFKQLNTRIEFDRSPFFIGTEALEWRAQGAQPLMAALNSFGHSGTNVHLVVREYPQPEEVENNHPAFHSDEPTLIPLSAKTQQSLKDYAEKLLLFIESMQLPHAELPACRRATLAEIAYTLQTAREAMEQRAIFIAADVAELKNQLRALARGENTIKNGWQGRVGGTKNEMARDNVAYAMEEGKLEQLAELWAQGAVVNWNRLYRAMKPRRINLPAYPFSRERYWAPEADPQAIRPEPVAALMAPAVAQPVIHPFLHRNTSRLAEQRFSSRFTGREFFLDQHVVKGEKILPGVAYLEMVRAAVEQAAERPAQSIIRLQNIVWARPITVGDTARTIHIGLFAGADGAIEYEIYSAPESGGETIIHSQGLAMFESAAPGDVLDIAALQARLSAGRMTAAECYQAYRRMAFEHGPAYQGIREIHSGANEVLAKIALPESVLETQAAFVLHPSLMDSALQAAIGLPLARQKAGVKPSLPFALEAVEILDQCPAVMWAWVRDFAPAAATGRPIQKLDIDIADEGGRVCVRLRGFTSRILEGQVNPAGAVQPEITKAAAGANAELVISYPVWRDKTVAARAQAPDYTRHLLLLCGLENISPIALSVRLEKRPGAAGGISCVCLQSQAQGVAARYEAIAIQAFEAIQKRLADKTKGNTLIQLLVSNEGDNAVLAGLAGLLKTVSLEHTKVLTQLIEVAGGETEAGLIEKIEANCRCPEDTRIRYGGAGEGSNQRQVAAWADIPAAGRPPVPWRDRGAYLITGGVGGLGLIFAEAIITTVENPTLILTGRAPLSAEKLARLEALESLGASIEYHQVDVSSRAQVEKLAASIRTRQGALQGILHSAGITRDNFIANKSAAEFSQVFAPKVAGTVNLDLASREFELDFFVLFSSGAGVLGNPGQADYAAANGFMDAYAACRNRLVAAGERRGKTLAVNWPLWKEGGMKVGIEVETMMEQATGMVAMQTDAGIDALLRALAFDQPQVMVMQGRRALIKERLLAAEEKSPAPETVRENTQTAIDSRALLEKVQSALLQTVARLTKLNVEDIDQDAELSRYGFESITLTDFSNSLRKKYGLQLAPTIFFEYSTLRRLANYLVEEHQPVLAKAFQSSASAAPTTNDVPEIVEQNIPLRTRRPARTAARASTPEPGAQPSPASDVSRPAAPDPIAVIGMSGRFPMAADLQAFWENLQAGRDCISEIPADRWDWQALYGDPHQEENKTNIKWGGFIEGVGDFDPLFFGVAPREAKLMDPQQRLLMTYVWRAMEDAGYSAASLAGSDTGIFVGTGVTGYTSLIASANIPIEGFSATGMVPSVGPNRMSFFLDWHGPSEPIETACSSSLIAIHRGVLAIDSGNCSMAMVGGVNTLLTPEAHISFSKAGMLCEDGRCKTFSAQANGYVRGEGVGMLLLKKLSAAEAAGDHIYGVIKSTAENHGGRANSLTAPNPKAQAALLQTAYAKAGIDTRALGYIEAHGTGTPLGDPIEINGLKMAFRHFPVGVAQCGVGSVKSNMGHLELAGGMAGVIKVLLQLQHKTLVKTLHCDQVNPYIELENTPFYLLRENRSWAAPRDDQGRELPRLAGVSSFGFGGTNAHVVIEEYKGGAQPAAVAEFAGPFVAVLSAKSEAQLLAYAKNLLAFVQRESQQAAAATAFLASLCYTLQVGRDAMEERLGLMVESVDDLAEKLQAFIAGSSERENIYRGRGKAAAAEQESATAPAKETLDIFSIDEDLAVAVEAWIEKRKYSRLLSLWVKGLNLDWEKLHTGASKPSRISAPTYPFAQQRYWVEGNKWTGKSPAQNPVAETEARLHPLLHQNTSTLASQRFTCRFTGEEFFLRDHRVRKQKILPGVAYLEMAREAVARALDAAAAHPGAVQLKNLVWIRPLVVDDGAGAEAAKPVHIDLTEEDGERIYFDIYSEGSEAGDEPVLYCQGMGVLTLESETLAQTPVLDLAGLRHRFDQGRLEAAQCYDLFNTLGIEYGPTHRGIEAVYPGRGEVLARLALPAPALAGAGRFVLHPALMDCALQASVGLLMGADSAAPLKPLLPFALEALEIFAPCATTLWAWIRYAPSAAADVQKLDIDLCDENGHLCVRLKGLSSRAMEAEVAAGLKTLTPVWNWIAPATEQPLVPAVSARVVIVGGSDFQRQALRSIYPSARGLEAAAASETITAQLRAHASIDHLIWIAPESSPASLADESLIQAQEQGVVQVFRLFKTLLALGYATKPFGCTLITVQAQPVRPQDTINPTHASVHGWAGALAKEYPHWDIRLLDMQADRDWPVDEMFRLRADNQGDARACRDGEWFRQSLIPVRESASEREPLYRKQGVYVVIGGAGGIGEAWSRFMIERYQARIIWIGRRQQDAAITAKLEALSLRGVAPLYIQADASDRQALQRAHAEIKQTYGAVHGVIHSAIVLRDQSLANMDETQLRASLAAKVDVSVRLAQVFDEVEDFVLFFSSMNAFSRAAGQSNYAAGCTFADAFARQLANAWPCAVKVMNWGYWGSVGIVTDTAYRERMAQAGIGSIEPEEGWRALGGLLQSGLDQIALVKLAGPAALAAFRAEESVTVYPDSIFSCTGALERQHASPLELTPADVHNQAMEARLLQLLHATLASLSRDTLQPQYERWLRESRRALEEGGYAAGQHPPAAPEALWQQWEQEKAGWQRDPNQRAQIVIVETCLRALPDILTGKVKATDVIFPESSMRLVEGIYQGNRVADYFNNALGELVIDYIRSRLAQQPQPDETLQLRILEVGAGSGGTSAGLFEKLRPWQAHIGEYCYTDLSKAFLLHAQEHFAAQNPYLKTALFDIGKPLAEQSIEADHYDLVIGTNVLHATKNIRRTLRNVKAALHKRGLLLLNEISRGSLFTHLTFGLLEGWWLYEDEKLRISGCPGLYPEAWEQVLEEEGFSPVLFPAANAHALGQQIVVAESDGIVRQAATGAAETSARPLPAQPARPRLEHSPAVKAAPADASLKEKTTALVKQVLAAAVDVPVENIQPDHTFEKYGVDSIIQINLIRKLEQAAGDLPRTVLFEHSSVEELVEYLVGHCTQRLQTYFGSENTDAARQTPAQPATISGGPRLIVNNRRRVKNPAPDKQNPAHSESEPIAIIGVSGRYPMANTLEVFWENLKTGKNCITEADGSRWKNSLTADIFGSNCSPDNKKYYAGFLDDIESFDHALFDIPRERAASLSPDLRLFLEVAWETFEDGGYTRSALQALQSQYRSGVGVFVGTMYNQYPWNAPALREAALRATNTDWQIPNRTSHFFNLTGPSIAVNTACSGSLTAIHLACESLRLQSCSMALAGGINLILDPSRFEALRQANFLGSGGRSKSFGAGDGMIPGEGVGAVLLKPLAQALADKDGVYAVIKSHCVNHSGGRQLYSAPDPAQQTRLIADSLLRAGVDPGTVGYIESAANGSELGDPIEVVALKKNFTHSGGQQIACPIGSVKSNIGHLEAASGISQLTKVLLQLKHGYLVPSINHQPRNPHLNFDGSGLYIQQTLEPWQPIKHRHSGANLPRRSMINSFGAGGSYGNLLLEEYVAQRQYAEPVTLGDCLLPFSAKTDQSLIAYLKTFRRFLAANPALGLEDVACSLHRLNHQLDKRLAIIAASIDDVLDKLDAVISRSGIAQQTGIYLPLAEGAVRSGTDYPQPDRQAGTLLPDVSDMQAVARYWVDGEPVDFQTLYETAAGNWVRLPKYAFHRHVPMQRPVEQVESPLLSSAGSGDAYLQELYEKTVNGDITEAQFENLIADL